VCNGAPGGAGRTALGAIQAEPPDLILLDILMPKVTGTEVLRALRSDERTRAIPVLILTNSSKESDVREIEKLGVAGYRVKSNLSLEELGTEVRHLLEG